VTRHKLTFLGWLLSAGIVTACTAGQPESARSTTYVYRCDGTDTAIVVTLSGDHGHLFSRQASQPVQHDSESGAFIGADVYYLPDQPPDLAPGQSAKITIMGKELGHCKNDPRAAVWEAAKLRGVSYRAVGQEPPWILDIHRGNGFLLSTGYEGNEVRFPYTEAESNVAQRRTRYRSELGGEQVSISIRGEPCHDSMSGEAFSSQVEVEWRGQTLRGCGRALH
jgi:uncharacterized membrane protein